MSEIKKIYKKIVEEQNKGLEVALATVISIKGSAYRRPGARMVISEDGNIFGMIGGGCFDADVKEIALNVMKTKTPELHLYDLKGDEVWGLGLGCNGSVYVLIESLSTEQGKEWLKQTGISLNNQESLLIEHNIDHPLHFQFNTQNGAVSFNRVYHRGSYKDDTNRVKRGSQSSVFEEIIKPGPRLVIFGAGHDVIPLVDYADQAGFHVCVVDPRVDLLNTERFQRASEFICARPENFHEKIMPKLGDYVIFMSHRIEYDAAAFKFYYKQPVSYFGFLGPKRRSNQIIFDFLHLDQSVFEQLNDRIHSPIGINIGSETAEQVAFSIVSELLAVKNHTDPKFLRDKEGSIHEKNKQNFSCSAPVNYRSS
jgi:xanthine dehydrogenase accessory factor